MSETETPTNLAGTQTQAETFEASSGNAEKPVYERRPHHPLSAAPRLILRTLHRYRTDIEASNNQADLTQDQISVMILEAMALADEFLVRPTTVSAEEQQRKRIEENELFHGKSGTKLADAFLQQLVQGEETALSEGEKVGTEEKIERNIAEILSHKQVRNEILEIFKREYSVRKNTHAKISELVGIENAIDTARARYRQLQNEPRGIDSESTALPTGILQSNLHKYLEIISQLERRIRLKEARLKPEESGLLEASRLLKMKRQMREYGFAMTESRQALFDRISELASQGYKIFLGGPTGTGKTSLAVFAMRQIIGDENRFEVVSWSPETTTRDLFGKPIIKATEEGNIESSMQKGPYARILTGETRGIINDEFTAGTTASQLSLKRIYQAHAGEEINLPGFNGTVFTKENYLEISTGNLRSKQHKERSEMDPAVAREFVSLSVPFMNSEEAEKVMLSSLIHETGFLPISRTEAEMVNQLCRAAEFSQKAFEDEFTPEEKQSDLYKQIDPSGAGVHLTKTFFDPATLFRLVDGISGRPFKENLRVNLEREINESPHLKTLPHEKEAFLKILKAFGFNLKAGKPEDFYRPKSTPSGSQKPYILPSEQGFLSTVEKITEDQFEGAGQAGSSGAERVGDGEWPFKEEEMSQEKIAEIYDRYARVYEQEGIVENGRIAPSLISTEVRQLGLDFAMPTREEFLQFIAEHSEKEKRLIGLGLIEPVIVPVAADLGEAIPVTASEEYRYSGLLDIVAAKIKELGEAGQLLGSDGTQITCNPKWPIYVNDLYKKLRFMLQKKDGTLQGGLTQKTYIEEQQKDGHPFPGWAIYFKERGNILPRNRDSQPDLTDMTADKELSKYIEALHDPNKLNMTGSSVHLELMLLLESLIRDKKVTRDWNNNQDAGAVLGANTFEGSGRVPFYAWRRGAGQLDLNAYYPDNHFSDVVGVPAGEIS
ncbi:MAG: hypothetical protein AAB360_02715 [Patescibacteria group bacterium]